MTSDARDRSRNDKKRLRSASGGTESLRYCERASHNCGRSRHHGGVCAWACKESCKGNDPIADSSERTRTVNEHGQRSLAPTEAAAPGDEPLCLGTKDGNLSAEASCGRAPHRWRAVGCAGCPMEGLQPPPVNSPLDLCEKRPSLDEPHSGARGQVASMLRARPNHTLHSHSQCETELGLCTAAAT